jgi:hypothetical protein
MAACAVEDARQVGVETLAHPASVIDYVGERANARIVDEHVEAVEFCRGVATMRSTARIAHVDRGGHDAEASPDAWVSDSAAVRILAAMTPGDQTLPPSASRRSRWQPMP